MLIRQFLCFMHICIRLSCVVPFQIRFQALTAVAFDKHLLALKLIKVKQLSVNMYALKSRLLLILLVFFLGHRVNHDLTFFRARQDGSGLFLRSKEEELAPGQIIIWMDYGH